MGTGVGPSLPTEDETRGSSPNSERGISSHVQRILDQHPRLARIVGVAGAVCLVLGYASTAIGHIAKLRLSLYENWGEQTLHYLHMAMVGAVVLLLLAGFAAAIVIADRRYLRRRAGSVRRSAISVLTLLALFVTAFSSYALLPEAPNTVKLQTEVSNRWRKTLLGTQSQDGGFRYSKVDLQVESQAWTTAQALAAILGRSDSLQASEAAAVRAALNFLDAVRLKDETEGWGYFDYVPWGVSEINAWVTIALARSISHASAPAIWGAQTGAAKEQLRSYTSLVAQRAMSDGGWAPIQERQQPKFARTYSTILSVWALLESRRVQPSAEVDQKISAGLAWILVNMDVQVGGWVPNPVRKQQLEGFPGLTGQVIYVLMLARPDFKHLLSDGRFDAMLVEFTKWLGGARIPPQGLKYATRQVSDNDRMHDSDRYLYKSPRMVESSTFLWYPWTVMACLEVAKARSDLPGLPVYPGCRHLAIRANEAIQFADKESFSYATAETLLAIDALAGLSKRVK